MGTVSATSLVTPQTIICASTFSSPVQLKSLSIGVYYDNKPLTGIGTPSENGTCVKVDRDWLLGGAQPGTSFFIT